jgi:hypothetical protein
MAQCSIARECTKLDDSVDSRFPQYPLVLFIVFTGIIGTAIFSRHGCSASHGNMTPRNTSYPVHAIGRSMKSGELKVPDWDAYLA